jgi:hypothetical protein
LGDSGLGGMSLAQRVEHDKVVDHSGVADRGYGHARCTKLVTVCLALVAQHIGFAVDDESWRQALEVFEGGVQRGGRDLGALGGVPTSGAVTISTAAAAALPPTATERIKPGIR